MTDVIFDCDITMGLPGRDVDDGLALLHLPGRILDRARYWRELFAAWRRVGEAL